MPHQRATFSPTAQALRYEKHRISLRKKYGREGMSAQSEATINTIATSLSVKPHSDSVEALWIFSNSDDTHDVLRAWELLYDSLSWEDRNDIDALCEAEYARGNGVTDEHGVCADPMDDPTEYDEPPDFETLQAHHDNAEYERGVAEGRQYLENKRTLGSDMAEAIELEAEQQRYDRGEE